MPIELGENEVPSPYWDDASQFNPHGNGPVMLSSPGSLSDVEAMLAAYAEPTVLDIEPIDVDGTPVGAETRIVASKVDSALGEMRAK